MILPNISEMDTGGGGISQHYEADILLPRLDNVLQNTYEIK